MAKTDQLVLDPQVSPAQAAPAVHDYFDLLALALKEKSAIDVIERLKALQLEGRRLDAEIEFNQSLAACTSELSLVINDSDKTAPGGKKWATYRALDREVRPAMNRHGLGLSWGSAESSEPEQMIMQAYVSKGLHTRTYNLPMDIGGKGPQGSGALSKPHAIGAGVEYGRRYLLKMIFNLVTGDEADQIATNGELAEQVEFIQNACDPEELKKLYRAAYEQFEATPAALKVLIAARKARKQEMGW